MRHIKAFTLVALTLGIGAGATASEAQSGPFPGVIRTRNGGLQAFYDQNGCTVDYDAEGRRTSYRSSACTSAQLRFAEEAVDDYRARYGLRPGDTAPGGHIERPLVSVSPEGHPYVTFERPTCVVYYSARGRRRGNTQHCSRAQIRRANDVIRRYLRDERPTYR